jgi:hypothetical protein
MCPPSLDTATLVTQVSIRATGSANVFVPIYLS